MALVVSKGTVLKQYTGGVFVAVAQLKSIGFDGAESETFESTTLDSGIGKTYTPTGYTEGGSFSATAFYDPALAGHKALTALMNDPRVVISPATAWVPQNWKVVFADTALTEMTFSTANAGATIKVDPASGLMLDFKGKITGLLNFPA